MTDSQEAVLDRVSAFKKLAVMGGTFDPIHYGHLVTAEAVRTEFDLEVILFIPTGRPPHKQKSGVSGASHRHLMTELAVVNNPYFYTSRMEIDRPGPTYTIDTIKALKDLLSPDAALYFITGADAVSEILTWKDAEALLSMCHFVAVTRPGYQNERLQNDVDSLSKRFKSNLSFLEVPALAISSSDIRRRVESGKAIKYLLPEAVEAYILKNGLYHGGQNVENLPKQDLEQVVLAHIEKGLSKKRLAHTMGVVKTAEALAKAHGENVNKTRLAALLHDVAKEYPQSERTALCAAYRLEPDPLMKAQPSLIHSFLGAELAKDLFGVTDEDVLNAIRYHTTGRRKMSLLEKIVFLADTTEEGRGDNPQLAGIKAVCRNDIDEAMVLSLKYKQDYCVKKGDTVHPLGLEALKYYRKKIQKHNGGSH